MPADEVLINGRRYRVPERVIVLDFWNKLNKYDEHVNRCVLFVFNDSVLIRNREPEIASGVSSPLTSLSSLEDDDHIFPSSGPSNGVDELVAAQVCNDLVKCLINVHRSCSFYAICLSLEELNLPVLVAAPRISLSVQHRLTRPPHRTLLKIKSGGRGR
jgi:hypothetical protein